MADCCSMKLCQMLSITRMLKRYDRIAESHQLIQSIQALCLLTVNTRQMSIKEVADRLFVCCVTMSDITSPLIKRIFSLNWKFQIYIANDCTSEVSGQLHAYAVLPPEQKGSWYLLVGSCVRPKSGLEALQEKKHPLTPAGIEQCLVFSVHNTVTVTTELHNSPNSSQDQKYFRQNLCRKKNCIL